MTEEKCELDALIQTHLEDVVKIRRCKMCRVTHKNSRCQTCASRYFARKTAEAAHLQNKLTEYAGHRVWGRRATPTRLILAFIAGSCARRYR